MLPCLGRFRGVIGENEPDLDGEADEVGEARTMETGRDNVESDEVGAPICTSSS